jgi:hypothetical protein
MAQRVRYSEDGLLLGGVGSPRTMSADTQALISEERTLWFYNKSRRPGRVRCRSFWAVVMPWIVAFTSMGTAAYLYRQLQTQHSRDSVELPYNPAMHLVRYENREFTLGLGDNLTKYEAEPSPSLDADWNDLFSSKRCSS